VQLSAEYRRTADKPGRPLIFITHLSCFEVYEPAGKGIDWWVRLQGGTSTMMKIEETKMDMKREDVIQRLVARGIFKIGGKQLYELPFYLLMKEYYKQV